MSEILDIYTKDGTKIGTMSKKDYYSSNNTQVPWIKCCSCFVIDQNQNKILFEKRGNTLIDAGKLDLCSGHVQSGEIPRLTMVRELNEELGIPSCVASNVISLGDVLIDYSELSDPTNRRNMKCIISMYALKLKDLSQIHIDNQEVVRYGWLEQKDAIQFIKRGMTRIPYEEELKKQYDKIFNQLDKCITNSQEQLSQEEK